MDVSCISKSCSILLNSKCVFYEGAALPYTDINTNDNVEESLAKIEAAIKDIVDNGVGGGGSTGVWGTFTGIITNQTDLTAYLASNYVPQARTLTINGTTFDLTANRSWTISTIGTEGHAIEYDGGSLTQRTSLNFISTGLFAQDLGGKTVISLANYTIEDVPGTTYTFVESDRYKIKIPSNVSGCTLTVPVGLPLGWGSHVYRPPGVGTVTIASNGSVEAVDDTLETEKTMAAIFHRGSNVHVVVGALGTVSGGGGGGSFANNALANQIAISDGTDIFGDTAFTWNSTDNILSILSGTAPVANITDGFQQYSADIVAGNAAPHFRTENGQIIKLYSVNTYSITNVTADRAYNANSTSMDELADVLGTLIADLRLTGLIL